MRSIAATKFKAGCLAILDDVASSGEGVTILKRGKPIARVVPVTSVEGDLPQRRLAGTIEILGDVVAPFEPADVWEAERLRGLGRSRSGSR